jgi:DNA transformation protein
MKNLTELPNIGKTLAAKLEKIGIQNEKDLINAGSESAFIRLSALENCDSCINMLYALEGAIQGIRWHKLDKKRKEELLHFYHMHLHKLNKN